MATKKYHDDGPKKKDPRPIVTHKDRLRLSGKVVEDSLDKMFGTYCEEHARYEPSRRLLD